MQGYNKNILLKIAQTYGRNISLVVETDDINYLLHQYLLLVD